MYFDTNKKDLVSNEKRRKGYFNTKKSSKKKLPRH